MKKIVKWIGIAVITPILLIIILAVLLYLPPVQNWAVKKVAAVASEKTGMEITVDHVNLEFPLNLGIEGFRALHPNDSLPHVTDTIADIGKMVVDVRLWPLLDKQIIINELSIQQAKVNTNGFISDVRIKGDFNELWLSSKGIDLSQETAEINGLRLKEAQLDINLTDTAAVDTTSTSVKWMINADSLSFNKSSLTLHLPGDTLNLKTNFDKAVARKTVIDIGKGIYKVGSLDWNGGHFAFNNRYEPETTDGIDFSHLLMNDVNLRLESFSFTPQGTSLFVKKAFFKEKSGLVVSEMTGGVTLDSTYNHIRMPLMTLRTPDSSIMTEADLDFTAFDNQNPGQMKVRLYAQLGKQDLQIYAGKLPQKFMEHFPNRPLIIRGSLNGNMQHLELTGIDINLATALHASIEGTADNVTDMSRLKADIKMEAKTKELNFMTALIDPKMSGIYRIPNGMDLNATLKANGTRYTADMTLHEGGGNVKMKGSALIPLNAKGEMVTGNMTYDADISINQLNLHHFLPKDSIYTLAADIKAKGHGTDLFSSQSRLDATATVRLLKYGYMNLDNLTASATLENGHAQASITGHNEIFDGTMSVDMLLNKKQIDGTVSADLAKADLYQMRLLDQHLTIGTHGSLKITSDMDQTHYVSGLLNEVYVKDLKKTYNPGDVGILIKTSLDTTVVRAQSGDFILKFDGRGGYERLLSQANILTDSVMAQYNDKVINQPAIKALLPVVKLHLESKRENPIANFLRAIGIDFKDMAVDLNTSPETGINGTSHIYSLVYDSTRIDTVRLNLTQKGERLSYQGQICNNKKNPQFVFNALIDGHIHEHGALAGLRYYDAKGKMGVRLGATAEMEQNGVRLRLLPERPTIGYKEFNLNKDNFIFLGSNRKMQAKIDLIADDKTGIKLYTEHQDSTMLQDLTLSVNRLDLGEVTSVIPYLPKITGQLNGDYHILQDLNEDISVASDMAIRNMTYEGSPIGNISTELVYLMKEDDTHAIEARLMLDDEEFGLLSGTYLSKDEGYINATFDMKHFPLSLANGFIPDQIVGFEGYSEGRLYIKGTTSNSHVDGEVYVDSAYLVSIPYGVRMRMDNDPIRIIDSKLLIENYGLYAYNNEPLNMMGEVDFSNLNNITTDLRMRARNLLLINAKQEQKSIAWGKAFVNFMARVQGPLETMKMRGRLDVLGTTDMTYLLLDSPLSSDNRLDELVKFTDFNDSTQTIITRPTPSGLDVDLTINVAQGAHIVCNLNTDQTNYVDLTGGGDLRMKYNSEGINLTGRYTLASGQMKYSLPVIPLKTFTVKDGSYVEFTGDPMNPKLNIIATEHTKATVSDEDGSTRSVAFDCGVEITKTLNDMGLKFIIEAPQDNMINSELSAMSVEERAKIAVAMLTTGMYLNTGNSGNFSMNSALSAFLQSEINNIAGSALKTIDISFGIENSVTSTGQETTDYSFQFSKRLFNNRLKIEIGGLLAGGANDVMGQKQSFFDNVSMEYRLNQEGTQNLKLFYQQNVYDWLEGYTSEYGAGFIWRRKLDNFWDIFRFWHKEPAPVPQRRPVTRTDSVRTDTIKVVNNETK